MDSHMDSKRYVQAASAPPTSSNLLAKRYTPASKQESWKVINEK